MSNLSRNPGFDLVRALSAIIVVLTHTESWMDRALSLDQTYFLRPAGFMAVEFFFALSGILLTPIILDVIESKNLKNFNIFILRRLLRTVPLYLVAMLGYTIYDKSPDNGAYDLYFIFSHNLISSMPSFFSVSWSLSIEEWFYLLMPILLALFLKFSPTGSAITKFRVALFVLIGITIFARLLYVQNYHDWDQDLRKVVFLRLDSIAIPALVLTYGNNQKTVKIGSAFLVAVFVMCLGVFWDDINRHSSDLCVRLGVLLGFSILPIGISFTILLVADAVRMQFQTIRFFAEISYPLYISHILVLILFQTYGSIYSLGHLLIYYATSILLAYALHRVIEKPILQMRPEFIKP